MPQGVVGLVGDGHQPRHAVEGGAALQVGAEAGQGVVDAGDAAWVRDRRQPVDDQERCGMSSVSWMQP
ncbi:hypothetical protein AB0K80_31600 [Streptomyces sp. NPDC052682]|uniref:hypothetical protein n=1 Tax=Streptomyces sp. NPDC052682 TaxID=3154954 RepID=UPI003445FA1B